MPGFTPGAAKRQDRNPGARPPTTRIVRPHPGTNRAERRRAQALAVANERRKARTAVVVASRKSGKEG